MIIPITHIGEARGHGVLSVSQDLTSSRHSSLVSERKPTCDMLQTIHCY